jgi:rhodanese-related sulfurtransferase
MKHTLWIVTALLLLAAPPARAQQEEDLSSPKLRVTWAEFKKLHDAKRVLVIDVRDPESFALGHIPGAISVPLERVEQQVEQLKKEQRPIVTYCA